MAAKWCAFDNDTVAIQIFVKDLRDASTIASKIYENDPQSLAEVIRLVEKLSAAHQLIATLTPSTVSMMSGDYKCFVCGWTGHFDHHCPDAHCYGCDELCHFTQDCPHKFPPSGTQCHHGRFHSRHWYIQNWRDRSYSHYGPRHRRHFSRSQSHPHSHCNRSSSFRRHTSCSSLNHCSSSCCPSANGSLPYPPPCDTNSNRCTPSHSYHISTRHHSCHSTDWSQSHSSISCHTAQGFQPRKVKQCPRHQPPINPTAPKTVSTQDFPSDSSSDSDSESDPLNY